MKSPAIGKRLLSASGFVRQDAYFADIGTDHAYLPLFLLGEGRITRAVCADINEGPLESARRNAEEFGYTESVSFVLTDGACGLSGMGITDYAICGMGGELICKIIEDSPHLKAKGIRLILQPMSRQSTLRKYLAKSGFSILGEEYSLDGGKYYLCLAAEYTAEEREISDFEAEFGDVGPRAEFSPEKLGYFEMKIKALRRAAAGKRLSGQECSEEKLLAELDRKMNSQE